MEFRLLFERNWRYFLFAILTVSILWALYTWRMTLLPFIMGLLLAYLFSPIVKFIERKLPGKGKWPEAKRAFAIIFIMLFLLALFAFGVIFSVTTLLHSSSDMVNNASTMIHNVIVRGQTLTQSIRDKFPESMRGQVDAVVNDLGSSLAVGVTGSLSSGQSIASKIMGSLGIVFSFAAMPVFLFYVLMDSEKIQKNIYSELPPNTARHAKNIVSIVECVLGRYIRGELILGAIVGSMSQAGLLVIRAPFAVPLAVFNGFCEMIPTIGPIIGGAVMSLVTLALAPDKVFWVLGLAVAVQLLENNLIAPKVMSSCLRLHPSVILVLLVMGGLFWGFWGLVLTVPLTATLVDIFGYVRSVNREENAKRTSQPQAMAAQTQAPVK
jgi:predicted PurR-regulated permease PerM